MMQEWLTINPGGWIFTNQDIIDNPRYAPDNWFNPFLEPEKMIEQRKDFRTAQDWKEYCEQYYPHLNPQEQYNLKIEDNLKEKQKQCGMVFIYIGRHGIPRKGRYKCGHCKNCLKDQAQAIRKNIIELNKPLNLIIVPESQRAIETRRLRNFQTYLVMNDGELECHILTDNQEIGESFNPYTFDFSQWTGTIPGKRQSGNLLGSTRDLVRGKNEDREDVLDAGRIMFRKIFPRFDKMPDGCRTINDVLKIASEYAVAKTIDFAPESIEEIQECYKERERLIIEAIRELGGVIYGIEYHNTSMRYVTEETPEEWLKAAQEAVTGRWRMFLE